MIGRFVIALCLGLAVAGCDSADERKVRLYEEGLQLLSENAPPAAQESFRSALRIDETFAPAHVGLAKALMAQNRPGPAAAHFARAVELDPQQTEARLDLAETLVGLREIDEALRHAEDALVAGPGEPRALAVKSAALLGKGDREAAVEFARQALDANPDLPVAWLTLIAERLQVEDFDAALKLIDDAAQRPAARDDPMLEVIRISVFERAGDREGLGEALTTLSGQQPQSEEIQLALARWHMQADPPEIDAAENILRALADAPDAEDAAVLRLAEFLNATQGAAVARAEIAARAASGAPGEPFDRMLAAIDAELGDRPAAIARLEAGIAAQPESDDGDAARILLARLLDPVEEAVQRADLVQAVLARDPGNVEALALRAEAYIRADRYGEAIQDLHAALSGAPQSPELLELLAVAHERDGAPDLARERRALAVQASGYAPEPSLRYAVFLISDGAVEAAEDVLTQALRRSPRNRDLLSALADARLRRGDLAGAEAVASEIEALGDTTGLDERIRAAALISGGRTEEGSALLQAAWEATGGTAELQSLVGLHVRNGEPEKAEALLEDAVAANPGNLRAQLMLSELRQTRGDTVGAEAALTAAIDASPQTGGLYVALSRLRAGTGDVAGAQNAIDAGLNVDPDNPALRFSLARRFERQGEIEAAIAEYDALYARAPDDLLIANNLASLLSEHRDDAASLERAAAIARRLPDAGVPVFLDTYGWTLHRIGRHAEAVEALKQSTEALDAEPVAHLHLGLAAESAGDAELARRHLSRAIELGDSGGSLPQRARAAAETALARLEAGAQ